VTGDRGDGRDVTGRLEGDDRGDVRLETQDASSSLARGTQKLYVVYSIRAGLRLFALSDAMCSGSCLSFPR